MMYCKADSAFAFAYFYFDFNDNQKQCCETLIRSLVLQLSTNSLSIPDALNDLFNQSQDGLQQPKIDTLTRTLRAMLGSSQPTFVVLDALDECAGEGGAYGAN